MRYLMLAILAYCCAACSSDTPAAMKNVRTQTPDDPIITRIVGRQEVIVVRAGAKGPTYSVEGNGGKIVIGAMTLGDLAKNQPQWGQKIRAMQASAEWAATDVDDVVGQ